MMGTAERSIDVMKRFDQSLPACARAAVKTGCAHAFHFDQITETRELILKVMRRSVDIPLRCVQPINLFTHSIITDRQPDPPCSEVNAFEIS